MLARRQTHTILENVGQYYSILLAKLAVITCPQSKSIMEWFPYCLCCLTPDFTFLPQQHSMEYGLILILSITSANCLPSQTIMLIWNAIITSQWATQNSKGNKCKCWMKLNVHNLNVCALSYVSCTTYSHASGGDTKTNMWINCKWKGWVFMLSYRCSD